MRGPRMARSVLGTSLDGRRLLRGDEEQRGAARPRSALERARCEDHARRRVGRDTGVAQRRAPPVRREDAVLVAVMVLGGLARKHRRGDTDRAVCSGVLPTSRMDELAVDRAHLVVNEDEVCSACELADDEQRGDQPREARARRL